MSGRPGASMEQAAGTAAGCGARAVRVAELRRATRPARAVEPRRDPLDQPAAGRVRRRRDRAPVHQPARLGRASVLRDDPRPCGVGALPDPPRRRAAAVRVVRRARLACRRIALARPRRAATTSRSASSSKGSKARPSRPRSTQRSRGLVARPARRAIRSRAVAGHEHVAPGRKNDPGRGLRLAGLRGLAAASTPCRGGSSRVRRGLTGCPWPAQCSRYLGFIRYR